jgi:hypothetical protein
MYDGRCWKLGRINENDPTKGLDWWDSYVSCKFQGGSLAKIDSEPINLKLNTLDPGAQGYGLSWVGGHCVANKWEWISDKAPLDIGYMNFATTEEGQHCEEGQCLQLKGSKYQNVWAGANCSEIIRDYVCMLTPNPDGTPAPTPAPTPVPSLDYWRCIKGQCIQDPSGISKEACAEMCLPLFECAIGQCVTSLTGGVLLATCQEACGPAPTPPPSPAPTACTCYPCGSQVPTTSFGGCGPPNVICSATAGSPTAGCWSSQCGPAGDCQCAAGTCTG